MLHQIPSLAGRCHYCYIRKTPLPCRDLRKAWYKVLKKLLGTVSASYIRQEDLLYRAGIVWVCSVLSKQEVSINTLLSSLHSLLFHFKQWPQRFFLTASFLSSYTINRSGCFSYSLLFHLLIPGKFLFSKGKGRINPLCLPSTTRDRQSKHCYSNIDIRNYFRSLLQFEYEMLPKWRN